MQTYYNIYFKPRDLDPISLPENVFRANEQAIMGRVDTLIRTSHLVFNPKDIRYIKKLAQPDTVTDIEVPDISEEKRQENLRRLAVLRHTFFSGKRKPEDWVNPYAEDNIKSQLTREELRAFRGQFFDVYFPTHEDEELAVELWLPYARGERDPRSYDREWIVEQVRARQ